MLSAEGKSSAFHNHCQWPNYRHLPIGGASFLDDVFLSAFCDLDGNDTDSSFQISFHWNNYFLSIFAEIGQMAITQIPNYLLFDPCTYLPGVTGTELHGCHHPLLATQKKRSVFILFVSRFRLGMIRFCYFLFALQYRHIHTFNSESEVQIQQFRPQCVGSCLEFQEAGWIVCIQNSLHSVHFLRSGISLSHPSLTPLGSLSFTAKLPTTSAFLMMMNQITKSLSVSSFFDF